MLSLAWILVLSGCLSENQFIFKAPLQSAVMARVGVTPARLSCFQASGPGVLLIMLFQLPEKFHTFNIFYLKRDFSMKNISFLSGELQI